jgi:hypothetical protein
MVEYGAIAGSQVVSSDGIVSADRIGAGLVIIEAGAVVSGGIVFAEKAMRGDYPAQFWRICATRKANYRNCQLYCSEPGPLKPQIRRHQSSPLIIAQDSVPRAKP